MSASRLTARMAKLNPFSKDDKKIDDEDAGEAIDYTTVAGGGHAARESEVTKHELRVSTGLQAYLVSQGILTEDDVGSEDEDHATPAVRELVNKPHINVPPALHDRSHPLPEYYISSSHNTYLVAHQLYGSSSADAYKTALRTGSRCVEIDAWDNDDNTEEPKVTHGYTLVSHVTFRKVCENIRDVVDGEAAQPNPSPVFISLENHCSAEGQQRLVDIMQEVWGERLLSRAVRAKGHEEQGGGDHVTLAELGSKIVVIVEYHWPDEPDTDSDDSDYNLDGEDEEIMQARKAYREKKKQVPSVIIPALADLGVYAQSVKPRDNTWFSEVGLKDSPHNHLINVSESGLLAHLPAESKSIARANAENLMRVFPKGTRIGSENLKPTLFWGIGAQICALNWQTFGASIQLNEALFSRSDGYVLKPQALRAGGSGQLNTGRKVKLRLHVGGATDVPVPQGREADEIKPYLTCTLYHPDSHDEIPKRKTAGYKQHKLGLVHKWASSPPVDPVWDEVLEWEYEDNELVFLRMLIKDDISFARNPIYAVAAVRLLYVAPGWNFIRMLDLKGRETRCSILVWFEIVDAWRRGSQ